MRIARFHALLVAGWLALWLGQSGQVARGEVGPKSPRVLLLNSYHSQYHWTEQFVEGVRATLADLVADERLHVEYMDARRFADQPDYRALVTRLLRHKYERFEPDLVITSDDFALDYMLQITAGNLASVPVVFGGVNLIDPSRVDMRPNTTGIFEGTEVGGNIDLIERLQPNVRRIILLSDQTDFGRRMTAQAREEQIGRLGSAVAFEIWDRFTLSGLRERLRSANADEAFLLLATDKEIGGDSFSYAEQLPELAELATVPIYGMWGTLRLGNGVLGGLMNDPREHGEAVASLAVEVLQGKSVEEIPIQRKARYRARFDYHQLQRLGIDQNRLPIGSEVAFAPESVWQRYWPLLTTSALVLLFMGAVIAALLNSNLHRQRAESELRQLNAELEQRVEARTADLHEKNEELLKMSMRMKHWANTDSLTELPNRRRGVQILRRHMIRTHADAGLLSVAVGDIDRFKVINDEHGHQIGDQVLKEVSSRLGQAVRPSDFLCRWGGEEFLIIFPGLNRQVAFGACERLKELVAGQPAGPVNRITISFGLTQLQQGDTLESLVRRADTALYQAKHGGRDRVVAG